MVRNLRGGVKPLPFLMKIPVFQIGDLWWFMGVDYPIGPYHDRERAEEKYLMYYQFLSAPECHHL